VTTAGGDDLGPSQGFFRRLAAEFSQADDAEPLPFNPPKAWDRIEVIAASFVSRDRSDAGEREQPGQGVLATSIKQ